MKPTYRVITLTLALIATLSLTGSTVLAATAVGLGTADSFAILGGSTVTNTGNSVINGNLGLSPGTSVTGFPPGVVNGVQHVTDATASQAQADLTSAYNTAAGESPTTTVATELGGATKATGVYDSADGTFGITGTLTLDGQGDPNAVFIFKTATTLITASSSIVRLINSAQACNVFWQVGSSATLGTDSTFKGNILALTSATLTTGAQVEGRVLARNAAVTLDTNTVTTAICASPTPTPTPTATPTASASATPTVNPGGTTSTATPTLGAGSHSASPTAGAKFPNTGLPPEEQDTPWGIILSTGLLVISLAALTVVLRKRRL